MKRARGFTLIELMVVVGVIAILVSILVPVVTKARNQMKAVLCQNNERQLFQGVVAFAAENDGRVVGNQCDDGNPIAIQRDFLRGNTNDWTQAPQAGTLFPFVNHNKSLYLCPSRALDPTFGTSGLEDVSSNGHFDYGIFMVFSGCKLEHIPPFTQYSDPTGITQIIPTPYLCEEQPNGLNGGTWMEGGHSNNDQLAHIHFGGSYYIAPDGSCQFFVESPGAVCWNYQARAPRSKTMVQLGNSGAQWGWWDGQ